MIKEDVKAQGSLYILFLLYRKLLCFGIKCIPKGTLVDRFMILLLVQDLFKELTGVGFGNLCNRLRCTLGDHRTSSVTALGPHINNMVCSLDNVKIMLDNEKTVSSLCKPVKN